MSFRAELNKHLTALPVTEIKRIVSKYNKELDIKPISKLKKAEILEKIKNKKPMDQALLAKLTNEARATVEGRKAQKASAKEKKPAKPSIDASKLYSTISKFLKSESSEKLGSEKKAIENKFNEAGKFTIDNPKVLSLLLAVEKDILKKVSRTELNNPKEKSKPVQKKGKTQKEEMEEAHAVARNIAKMANVALRKGKSAREIYDILEKLNKLPGGNSANVTDTMSNFVDSEISSGGTTSTKKIINNKSEMKKYLDWASNSYFVGDAYKNPDRLAKFYKEAETLFGVDLPAKAKEEPAKAGGKEPKKEAKDLGLQVKDFTKIMNNYYGVKAKIEQSELDGKIKAGSKEYEASEKQAHIDWNSELVDFKKKYKLGNTANKFFSDSKGESSGPANFINFDAIDVEKLPNYKKMIAIGKKIQEKEFASPKAEPKKKAEAEAKAGGKKTTRPKGDLLKKLVRMARDHKKNGISIEGVKAYYKIVDEFLKTKPPQKEEALAKTLYNFINTNVFRGKKKTVRGLNMLLKELDFKEMTDTKTLGKDSSATSKTTNTIIENWGATFNNAELEQKEKRLTDTIRSQLEKKGSLNIDGLFSANPKLANDLFAKYPPQKVLDGYKKYVEYLDDEGDKEIGQDKVADYFEERDGRLQPTNRAKGLSKASMAKLEKANEFRLKNKMPSGVHLHLDSEITKYNSLKTGQSAFNRIRANRSKKPYKKMTLMDGEKVKDYSA